MLTSRGSNVEPISLPLGKGNGFGTIVAGINKGPVSGLLDDVCFSPTPVTLSLNMIRALNLNNNEGGGIDNCYQRRQKLCKFR